MAEHGIEGQIAVSTHSRLKAAGCAVSMVLTSEIVSTHSRLKAAGCLFPRFPYTKSCFNTQPPEGGWYRHLDGIKDKYRFNTQPPEGGWFIVPNQFQLSELFQHTAA